MRAPAAFFVSALVTLAACAGASTPLPPDDAGTDGAPSPSSCVTAGGRCVAVPLQCPGGTKSSTLACGLDTKCCAPVAPADAGAD